MLFTGMATQWRRMIVPMTAVMILEGMIYQALPEVAAMMGITMTPALFSDIMIMEAAAMAEANR